MVVLFLQDKLHGGCHTFQRPKYAARQVVPRQLVFKVPLVLPQRPLNIPCMSWWIAGLLERISWIVKNLALVVQRLDWIRQYLLPLLIHWIVIYLVDSLNHSL